MEGFLWLLLQTLPLLAAAAFVFFVLGWRWRGQSGQTQQQKEDQKLDDQDIQTESVKKELMAVREIEEKLRQKLSDTQTELQESQARETQLQKEILRLSDELKQPKASSASTTTEAASPTVNKSVAEKKAPSKVAKKAAKGKKKPSK